MAPERDLGGDERFTTFRIATSQLKSGDSTVVHGSGFMLIIPAESLTNTPDDPNRAARVIKASETIVRSARSITNQ